MITLSLHRLLYKPQKGVVILNIVITGAGGRMGRQVALCAKEAGIRVLAGIDLKPFQAEFPVYQHVSELSEKPDLIIDFSHPSALSELIAYSRENRVPLELCTTGYNEEQLSEISALSKVVPVFRSANMSLGINVLCALVKKAAEALPGYDVEIVEMHHNKKLDAPSGTANMLLSSIQSADPDKSPVYDRHSVRKQRDPKEVGMHSLRGGTVVGEHSVIFAGPNEVVTLSHSAESRDAFAEGAIRAAQFMNTVSSPGLYDMNDVIGSLI